MHRAQTITCSSQPETGTAADLGITNVNPTDVIHLDFSAKVVLKP